MVCVIVFVILPTYKAIDCKFENIWCYFLTFQIASCYLLATLCTCIFFFYSMHIWSKKIMCHLCKNTHWWNYCKDYNICTVSEKYKFVRCWGLLRTLIIYYCKKKKPTINGWKKKRFNGIEVFVICTTQTTLAVGAGLKTNQCNCNTRRIHTLELQFHPSRGLLQTNTHRKERCNTLFNVKWQMTSSNHFHMDNN